MKAIYTFAVLGALAFTGACQDLEVENINDPDQERALSEASDVQALLGTGFYRFINGVMKSAAAPRAVAANEITSSWGNYGMRNAGTLPRAPFDNSPTASYTTANSPPWGNLYEGLSNVADGLNAVNQGMTFEDESGNDATARAQAYGRFVQGVITGWLASFYDQVVIFDEDVLADIENTAPAPVPWPEALDKALQYLDDAISIAEAAPPFELPGGEGAWIHGNPLNNEQLIQWANSYYARYLVISARTPAERQAVNWAEVVSRLDRGVQEMVGPNGDQSPVLWWHRPSERPDGWVRAAYDLIGPADNSGAYEEWLATDPFDRQPFYIVSDDRRIVGPDGGGPDGEPGKYVRRADPCNVFPTDRGTYFESCYYFNRFSYRDAGSWGILNPLFIPLAQDHMRAEAILRAGVGGDRNQAIDIINTGRVENGELPPIPYTISDEELWEVFAYEKAIEQAVSMASQNFFDRRGLGTMICGTPIQYPIPGSELEVMRIPNYTFGGSGEGTATESSGCRTPDEPATKVVLN